MKSLFLRVLLSIPLLLSACSSPPAAATSTGSLIQISDPWVRTAPGSDELAPTAALFLVIHNNGSTADTLTAIQSPAARMAELHLTKVDSNGVASMQHIDELEIPAGGSVQLKPGSYHVMLMGLAPGLQAGSTATFTLIFEKAGAVVIEAPVKDSSQ
jgi:copper(I)-binding protein